MDGWSGDRSLPEDGDAEDRRAQLPDLVEGRQLVLPVEIEPSVEAFLVASTQWRWATGAVIGPMGVAIFQPMRMGLDYVGAQAAWSLAGLTPSPEIFANVRLMEATALVALGEARRD
jgi:hypothetical protein